MKILILLLAVIGFCKGLEYPLEYQYRYFSSIASGVPALSNQASGVALQCDIIIQVEKNGRAMFQLRNVEMAQFNDKLGCDLQGDIPVEFATPKESHIREMLEEPFEVHLSTNEAIAFTVKEGELLWITNVRKGIVLFVRNEFIRGNFEEPADFRHEASALIHEGKVPNSFHLVERTIFGNCMVDYTVHKVPKTIYWHKNPLLEQSMEVDVQKCGQETSDTKTKSKGKKKYIPPVKKVPPKGPKPTEPLKECNDDLWHLVRTVNFDECEESVDMQSVSFGIEEELHGDQVKWLRSRSSVSEIILRGKPGAARIEKATIVGTTMLSANGINAESLQIRTNQTYKLIAVRKIKNYLYLASSCEDVTSWMQQVYSTRSTPKINKPEEWLIYGASEDKYHLYQSMGAESYTKKHIEDLKNDVINSIKQVSLELSDLDQEFKSPLGHIVDTLHRATLHMKLFSKDDIHDIFKQFESRQVHANEVLNSLLVMDVAAAAATHNSLDALTDLAKAGKIPDSHVLSMAITTTNNFESPTVLPSILEFVMSLDLKEKPFLGSSILMNFANLLHNLCISPKALKIAYPGKTFGDDTCDLKFIKDKFAPYLTNMALDNSGAIHEWQREVAIKALGALDTPFAIPIVRNLIIGKKGCSKTLAMASIYILDGTKLHKHTSSHVREEVMSMMMEVFSNIGEDANIRQAALSVIASWGPKLSFWHRLARTSWTEPSKQVATYITTLIEGMANIKSWHYLEQSQAAASAATFTKPVSPGIKYSYVKMFADRIFNLHVSRFSVLEWIKDAKSPFAVDTYLLMMMNLGGFEMVNLEFILNFDLIAEHIEKVNPMKQGTIKENLAASIAKDFFTRIQNTIKASTPHDKDQTSANLFIRIFEHMQLNLPINAETLKTLSFNHKAAVGEFVLQLISGYDFTTVKYFNPISMLSFHASDVGLPIIIRSATPIVISAMTLTSGSTSAKTFDPLKTLRKAELKSETVIKMASQGGGRMQILVPWSNNLHFVEVKTNREITLPVTYTLRSNFLEDNKLCTLTLDCESYFYKKFPVLRADNQPSTGFISIFSLSPYLNDEITALERDTCRDASWKLPQTYTGLQLEITWKSALAFPFTKWSMIQKAMELRLNTVETMPLIFYALGSTVVEGWYIEINFDPELSKTKKVSFEFSIACGKEPKPEDPIDPQQTLGGQSQDYYNYEEGIQQTGTKGFGDDQGEVEILETTQQGSYFGKTTKQRAEKYTVHYGESYFNLGIKAEFTGDEHRSYEVAFTKAKPNVVGNKKQIKAQLDFITSSIPGVISEPNSVCFHFKKSSPHFTPLDTLSTLLETEFEAKVEVDVIQGCTEVAPFITWQGRYHLSEDGKNALKKEISKSCDKDPNNELIAFHNHAVFDSFKYVLKRRDRVMHRISGKRCLDSHRWNVFLDKEIQPTHELDNFLNAAYHIGKYNWAEYDSHYSDHSSIMGSESEKCSVQTSHVRTFDGLTYDYKPSKCWTVAYKDCSHEFGALLLVRSTKGESNIPEVRYISENQQFVVDINHHNVIINGDEVKIFGDSEDVKDEDGDFIATVFKKNDNVMVKFAPGYYITVKDRVEIKLPEHFAGKACGLCGDFNSEPYGDLLGPQQCQHKDINTFVASWSSSSDTCNTYAMYKLRKDVAASQKSCRSEFSNKEAGEHTCSNYNEYCTQYNWKIFGDTEITCISESPVPICSYGCQSLDNHIDKVIYQCWVNSSAPETITTALQNGETHLQKWLQIHEHFLETRYENIASACKKF